MKINCSIIQDLLPLYLDDVCSQDSKIIVEKHLKECEECSKILEDMSNDTKISKAEVQKIKEPFKKIKFDIIKRIIRTILITFLILIVLFQVICANGYIIPLEEYKTEKAITQIMQSFTNKDFETFSNSIAYDMGNYNQNDVLQMLNGLLNNDDIYNNIHFDMDTYFEGYLNSEFLTGVKVYVYSSNCYIEMMFYNTKNDKNTYQLSRIISYTNFITPDIWKYQA